MEPSLGIFWLVAGQLVAAGCPLKHAGLYGDCLTYDGGHAEHWEKWKEAGQRWIEKNGLPLAILTSEYDEHPRGRVVKEPAGFVIYADRRLHKPTFIARICHRFNLDPSFVTVRSDAHYRHSQDSW